MRHARRFIVVLETQCLCPPSTNQSQMCLVHSVLPDRYTHTHKYTHSHTEMNALTKSALANVHTRLARKQACMQKHVILIFKTCFLDLMQMCVIVVWQASARPNQTG